MNITVTDVRNAILYVCQNDQIDLQHLSDEELLDSDFIKDFNIGNIRLINVISELQQVKNFAVPYEVFRTRPDDTVRSFITAINQYLTVS